jgi:redox-sensing transcriptional repressor
LKRYKTIERLIIYKFILEKALKNGEKFIYSHQIAEQISATSSQVRRDIMELGYSGSHKLGYNIQELINSIKDFIEPPHNIEMIIVGIGNLGRALLRYFSNISPKYSIVAGFDKDKDKIDTFILQCKCYSIDRLNEIVSKHKIQCGIITVPSDEAQNVAQLMVEAGIRGIMNFAPIRIKVPDSVFVENIDISLAIDKVAYFADKIGYLQSE